ncbi:MAG: PEP-CTERM sorting domain-containing protein [Myxococcota bacterium]
MPEPSSFIMLGSGLMGLAGDRRRRRADRKFKRPLLRLRRFPVSDTGGIGSIGSGLAAD